MKISSDALFRLVHALDKGEKRIVSKALRAEYGAQSVPARMFKIISLQALHDDKLLKAKVGRGITDNAFAVNKHMLQGLILERILRQNGEKNIDIQVHLLLAEAEYLFQKKLYGQSKRKLQEALVIADAAERFLLAAEVESRLRTLLAAMKFTEASEEDYNRAQDIISRKLDSAKEVNEAEALWGITMFLFWKSYGITRSGPVYEKLLQISRNSMLRNPQQAHSSHSRLLLLSTNAFICHSTGDQEKAYQNSLQAIQLADEEMIRTHFVQLYASAFITHSVICSNSGRWEESFHCTNILAAYFKEDKTRIDKNFLIDAEGRLLIMQSHYYVSTGKEPEHFTDFTGEIERYIRKRNDPGAYPPLIYNMFYLHFQAGNFKKALKWINIILDDKRRGFKEELIASCLVINLFTHYELQNIDQLRYYYTSVYRYLHKKHSLYDFEKNILSFVKHVLIRELTPAEFQAECVKFEALLLKFSRDGKMKKLITSPFDFLSWTRSKINGTTIREEIFKAAGSAEKNPAVPRLQK